MTREDAYYERIKLLCGYWDSYDEWLDSYLESEDPLSDIVLQLIDCQSNMKEVEYCLNLYCREKPFDEESVYKRLQTELGKLYGENAITTDHLLSALFRISQVIPFCRFSNDCSTLSDYYVLVEEGLVDIKKFTAVLEKWLKDGDAINTDEMWKKVINPLKRKNKNA